MSGEIKTINNVCENEISIICEVIYVQINNNDLYIYISKWYGTCQE